MKKINRDGNGTEEELPNYVGHNLIVIGLNPNKRMLLLERYVEQTPNNVIMFEPLQHLLGIGAPRAVFTELDGIPESGSQLNVNQRKVANPLELKTAMEVAGPPGTGKTKTIIELVRALLSCTSSDIIVLSERNGAINAIAEKFKKESMKRKGGKFDIIDLEVWQSVMAYGNAESMGESTKLFTVDNKIK
jgi:ATP-dependent exoDNAse (exonuclease V) alpha subunit